MFFGVDDEVVDRIFELVVIFNLGVVSWLIKEICLFVFEVGDLK